MSAQDAANRLGTDGVGKLLIQYSLPAIVGTAAASLYNIIDRVFIGHGVGAMAISGLALTLPMMNLAAAFGALVGAGAAALVSIRLGEGRRRDAHHILGNTVFLNLVLSTTYSVVCWIFLDQVLFLMGASHETLPYARQFMRVILLGNVCTHVYMGLNNVMRASGYPRKAMLTTLLTVAVNLALAPLFIFVFGWGIRGAAFATVCAQAVGTVRLVWHFLRKESSVRFVSGCFKPDWTIIRGIFSIGMSNFVMLFCSTFVVVTYNLRLGQYGGDYAIGAFGVVNSLAMLVVMTAAGVNMGMQPVAGYNYGARQFDRVVRVFRLAIVASTTITTTGFLLGEAFPRLVASAFTRDRQLIDQSVTGMRLLFAMFPLVGFQMVTANFFQAIGRAKISVLLSLSRQVLILIPCLIVLPLYFGLHGVWLSEAVSDFTSTLVALVVLKAQFRKSLVARVV
jgi:putative MATE family efflux protein